MREHSLRDRTILVIEDDDDFREVFRLRLESLGAHVRVAADGLEGLRQMARPPLPNAVLCDVTMPIMDGLEFARRVRLDPRYRRVLLVAVTGWGRYADVLQTWHAGFDAHLVKPVSDEALRAFARRVVGDVSAESPPGA
jgi:two-component system, chemotaxis family, CheB/CheR fusion protein